MHELSIAQQLVEQIEDELAVRGVAAPRGDAAAGCEVIGRVFVRVGALSGVAPEALAAAFPMAAAASWIAGAALVIERCPAVVWCERCDGEQTLPSAGRMRCPDCGALCKRLVSGRELELTSIEVLNVCSNADAAANPRSPNQDPEKQ